MPARVTHRRLDLAEAEAFCDFGAQSQVEHRADDPAAGGCLSHRAA